MTSRSKKLAEYLTKHLEKPFKWGSHDCVSFANNWMVFDKGVDYLADLPKWKTEKRALEIIQSVGGLEAAMDARLKRIHPNLAKDGDIALYEGRVGIFSGSKIVGTGINGLFYVDRTKVPCAWSY